MEEALGEDPTADLGDLLPPPSSPRERLIALHEMIKIELEFRWGQKRPATLEDYLRRFPELGPAATLPVELIFEEYRARHRYGDRPPLESYKKRFPDQYERLLQKLRSQSDVTFEETNSPFTRVLPDPRSAKTVPPSPEPVPPPPVAARPSDQATAGGAQVPKRPPSSTGTNSKTLVPVEGGYELLQRIGHGQFGEVFKARAPGGVTVALKRIFRPLDDAATLRERKALDLICQLNHVYLLQTHLYWVDEGRLVIVMELADGSLGDWLKECKAAGKAGIPVGPLLEYFDQAARALDYLHGQKPPVMHRDIKPANLLRLKGYAKVADFGLLREQDHNLATATYCGTPAYMPPEMWNSKIHVNSDQYSLAVTYVEMRLGRRCFTATNPRDLAFQHLEGAADLTGLGPAERKVLTRALSPDPAKRYPSCLAFVSALKEALQPAPKTKTAGPRLLTGLLATGFVLALAVIGVLLVDHFRSSINTDKVEGPKADWNPRDWEPPPDQARTDADLLNRRYWTSLSRTVKGQKVTLLAIPQNNVRDPDTFYIMQDKVWNDLFKAVMDNPDAEETLRERVRESNLQTDDPKSPRNYIQLGQWRLGAAVGDRNLGVDGDQGRLPVMRVTVLESLVFAEQLGGKIPSKKQWFKAAGKGEGKHKGPFVEDLLQPNNFQGIAVGLAATGPRPVGMSERDRSIYGCRDQAGNGNEWTRTLVGVFNGEVPCEIKATPPLVFLAGKSFVDDVPLEFTDPDASEFYNQTAHYIGFRIVLEEKDLSHP
jgi:serine/threonine protein kinase